LSPTAGHGDLLAADMRRGGGSPQTLGPGIIARLTTGPGSGSRSGAHGCPAENRATAQKVVLSRNILHDRSPFSSNFARMLTILTKLQSTPN